MPFLHREKKIEIEKSQKRVQSAFLFLSLMLVIMAAGFLIRAYRQVTIDFEFFRSPKILKPILGKPPEQELAEELKKAGFSPVTLFIKGENEIEASLSGGTKVLFKTERIPKQVSSLQLMLPRFKIEGRIPQKIDLRFEKPIVVF